MEEPNSLSVRRCLVAKVRGAIFFLSAEFGDRIRDCLARRDKMILRIMRLAHIGGTVGERGQHLPWILIHESGQNRER